MNKLEISPYNPNFIGDNFSVTFLKDNSFEITGKMEQVSFDLNFRVAKPPVTNKDIFLDALKEQDPNVKNGFGRPRNESPVGKLGGVTQINS